MLNVFYFPSIDEYSIGATPQQLTSNSSQGTFLKQRQYYFVYYNFIGSDDLVIPKPRAKVPGILVPGGLQVRSTNLKPKT